MQLREIQHGSLDYDQEVRLRSEILREPLGLKFTADELARENADIHLGAFDGDRLVGCLILVAVNSSQMKMRQVAIDETVQGRGIGRQLVLASEEKAKQLGFS